MARSLVIREEYGVFVVDDGIHRAEGMQLVDALVRFAVLMPRPVSLTLSVTNMTIAAGVLKELLPPERPSNEGVTSG